MADFCFQCTEKIYGGDVAARNDFAEEEDTPDMVRGVLCEGCGFTLVDSAGRCQHKGHADAESARRDYNLASSDLQRIAHELGIPARPYSGHEAMERDILPRIQYLRRFENGTQLAYQITLEAMLGEASKTLRELADMDDDGSPRLMMIAGEAKRTLKAMREIGSVN